MHRIAVVLALLILVVLPRPVAHAAAATLERPTFTCSAGGATLRFAWRPADGTTAQYIDVSLAGSGFAPGTFISAGPFDGATSSHTWTGIRPNVRHYYRVNSLTPDGWQASGDTFTAPCRPVEASVGGRDAPFSIFPGVYVLDLASGVTTRLMDTRGHSLFYPNDRTFDWSPDGSRIAVVHGRLYFGLHVYDALGALQSEAKESGYQVDWLSGESLVSHMRRQGGPPPGEEGDAIINARSGAIESFLPGTRNGFWSPDGSRSAYFQQFGPPESHGLFVSDTLSGEDRQLRRGEFVRWLAWSPDGTRLAASQYMDGGAQTLVLDATTGAETRRLNRGGLDYVWSPDGRLLAMAAYSESGREPLEIVVLSEDGSVRTFAQGTRPSWSPDGLSLSYIRDGALWLTTLGDGKESPLLRPQMPLIQEQRWSPAGDKIAFRVGGSGGIYVARPDGSDERYLTPGTTPEWSPKGDRLAFIYGEGQTGLAGGIYTMTPRGTAINRLGGVNYGDVAQLCWNGRSYAWSPDSSRLVYTTQVPGDSSGRRRMTTINVVQDIPDATPKAIASGHGPSWTPDGLSITYAAIGAPSPSQPLAPQSCEVSTVSATGGESKVITGNAQAPRLSPDGSLLAVEGSPINAPSWLHATSGSVRIVRADESGQLATFRGGGARWSPDGKRIAYSRSSAPEGAIPTPHTPNELVVSNPDGSPAKVIATSLTHFDWSPDGTRIIFTISNQIEYSLNVYDLATGVSTVIGKGSEASYSPDGQWIAFTRY